jgi:hypothetical protein
MVTTLENHEGVAPRNQGDNNFPRIDWFRKSGRSQLPRMDISFYLLTNTMCRKLAKLKNSLIF